MKIEKLKKKKQQNPNTSPFIRNSFLKSVLQ